MGIEFIKHSAKGTTWTKKDHKYVSKTVKNGKTYYKYNSKTKKYDKYDLQKNDTIPQTPEEEAKFYMNQLIGGLESAQRKLLSSKGIIADDSAYNHMLITDKNFAAKQNLKSRRAKHSDELEGYSASMTIADEDSIEHHGIQGQKWGERNGPPYPLDANKATQAKKKAAAADKPYAKKDYNKTSSGSSGSGDSVKTHGTNKSYGGSQKLTFKERRAQALERKAAKAEERAAYQKRLSDARQRAVKAREAERSAKQKAADAERKEKEKLLAEKQKAKEAKEKVKEKAQEAKNQKPEVKEQPKNTVVQTRIQQPQQNQNNQQPTQQAPQNADSRKQQILDSKNPMLLYQNKDMFTDQELQSALARLRNEQQLRDMVNKPVPSKTKQFIDQYTSTAKTVKEVYDATKNAAEVVRDVTTIFGMKDSSINKVASAIAGTKSLFDDGKSKDKTPEDKASKDKGVKDKANQQTKQSEQQFKQTVENAARDFSQKASNYRSKRDDIFDADYTEVVPRETLALPLNQFLLEDKRARHDAMDEDLDFLEHHGVQGQKWGERNGPPYPLDSDAGKQAQKKAAAADNPSSKKDYNAHGQKTSKPAKETKSNKSKWDHTLSAEERAADKKADFKERTLTQARNTGITAMLVVAASGGNIPLAAGWFAGNFLTNVAIEAANAKYAEHKESKAFSYREKNETKDSKTGLYLKDPAETTLKKDIANVNPGFRQYGTETKNNCMLCSVALDLRLKGYDVMANRAAQGYPPDSFTEWYKGAKLERTSVVSNSEERMKSGQKMTAKETKAMYDSAVETLSKQKNANGAIDVDWTGGMGSGHSMQYVVRDGNVSFIDAQCGQIMHPTTVKKIFKGTTGEFQTVRLDDKELDYKKFSKYLVR